MDGFDFAKVGELINLPKDDTVAMFVVAGKALKPAQPRPAQLAMQDIVIQDRF
jgi:hypothetical protein